MKRMENERIAKRVYIGVCAGSSSVGRPRKRGIDNVKECLKSGKQGESCMMGVYGGGL